MGTLNKAVPHSGCTGCSRYFCLAVVLLHSATASNGADCRVCSLVFWRKLPVFDRVFRHVHYSKYNCTASLLVVLAMIILLGCTIQPMFGAA